MHMRMQHAQGLRMFVVVGRPFHPAGPSKALEDAAIITAPVDPVPYAALPRDCLQILAIY